MMRGIRCVRTLLALLVALAPCASDPSVAQERTDFGRFVDWVGGDAKALVQSVDARDAAYVAGGAAVLIPLSRFDERINPEIQESYRGNLARFLDFTNELGSPKVVAPLVAVFGASLLTDDTKLQDAAFTSMQSLLYAGLVTYGLKYTVGRMRPYEGNGSNRFLPLSGHNSFPSGHTTVAFAIVTPWVVYYPHPVTYGLFALSAGTAVARLAHNAHWATDVAAGAAIGTVTGYWLTKRHQGLQRGASLTPTAGPDALGFTLNVTF